MGGGQLRIGRNYNLPHRMGDRAATSKSLWFGYDEL